MAGQVLTDSQLLIRALRPDDLNFVLATWLRAYRYSWFAYNLRGPLYYAGQERLIRDILARPDTVALVAALDDDPDAVLGYLVASPGCIHFAYTKGAWRQMGIQTQLVLATGLFVSLDGVEVSHPTDRPDGDWSKWISTKYPRLVRNPYRSHR